MLCDHVSIQLNSSAIRLILSTPPYRITSFTNLLARAFTEIKSISPLLRFTQPYLTHIAKRPEPSNFRGLSGCMNTPNLFTHDLTHPYSHQFFQSFN